jgi:hypothetical protein
MSSIFARGLKLYAKVKSVAGTWEQLATGYNVGEEAKAERWVLDRERDVEAQRRANANGGELVPLLTVRAWAKRWLEERKRLDLDWRNDRGRLEMHVLPHIGDILLVEVRTKHLVELFHSIRTVPRQGRDKPAAPRLVYNIYSVVSACSAMLGSPTSSSSHRAFWTSASSDRCATGTRSGVRKRCSLTAKSRPSSRRQRFRATAVSCTGSSCSLASDPVKHRRCAGVTTTRP